MLPATLQFLITMIACAINERMQRKLDYTQPRGPRTGSAGGLGAKLAQLGAELVDGPHSFGPKSRGRMSARVRSLTGFAIKASTMSSSSPARVPPRNIQEGCRKPLRKTWRPSGRDMRCLCGQPVRRELRVELQWAEVVFEYVGAPTLVGQSHPDNLIEATWSA
jgi:hypothetical protein